MRCVNRALVIVRPRDPYIGWARSVDDEAKAVTAAELNRDRTVYLIPETDDDAQAEQALRDRFNIIFEHELAAWMVDESIWPANRTYKMFREWFEIEVHSLIVDLCNQRLQVEEL